MRILAFSKTTTLTKPIGELCVSEMLARATAFQGSGHQTLKLFCSGIAGALRLSSVWHGGSIARESRLPYCYNDARVIKWMWENVKRGLPGRGSQF